MGFLYFAYGSNMLPARLQARCSTARVIGTATAQNFELNFSKLGKDSSGKATLVESAIGGTVTPGVLFEIERIELHHLDQAEGAGYDRDDDFHVTCASTGEIVVATTYLANAIKPELEPFDWYLALVLAGGHHNSLNQDHQRRLRANNYFVDTDHSRESRTEALRALSLHNYDDHKSLLRVPRKEP